MNRRDFAIGLSLSIIISAARGQEPAKQHRIAIVIAAGRSAAISETEGSTAWRVFFGELRRLGYVEGGNLIIQRYSAEGRPEPYGDLTHTVVARNPELIVAAGTTVARAFRAATDTIPIVASLGDALRQGLVASHSHPAGNITGVSNNAGIEIWGKRLQILKEAIPSASKVALLGMRASFSGVDTS